jgi:hypothetical protein
MCNLSAHMDGGLCNLNLKIMKRNLKKIVGCFTLAALLLFGWADFRSIDAQTERRELTEATKSTFKKGCLLETVTALETEIIKLNSLGVSAVEQSLVQKDLVGESVKDKIAQQTSNIDFEQNTLMYRMKSELTDVIMYQIALKKGASPEQLKTAQVRLSYEKEAQLKRDVILEPITKIWDEASYLTWERLDPEDLQKYREMGFVQYN